MHTITEGSVEAAHVGFEADPSEVAVGFVYYSIAHSVVSVAESIPGG